DSTGAVTIRATDSASIAAFVGSIALSVGVGGGAGVGVAIGISVARNFIGEAPTPQTLPTTYNSACSATDALSTCLPSQLNPGGTVPIVGGPPNGQTFKYIGSQDVATTIPLDLQHFHDTNTWTDLGTSVSSHTYTTDDTPTTLHNGDTVKVISGADAGH